MAVGTFKLPISSAGEWVRPTDWLPMPTGITSANQTFVGLYAIFPSGQNYASISFTTSTGQYRVDWGDGTITLHNSGTTAQYQYDYATISNSTLTNRGYKQSMITVTAVSGNLLSCSLQVRFVSSPIQTVNYSSGFLDCILSMPNAITGLSIVIGGTSVGHRNIERFDIKTIGSANNLSNIFSGCFSLQSVPLFNTQNVTLFTSMFNTCRSLKNIPLFNTQSAQNMVTMFTNCFSLQSVPLFNTLNVTNMQSMFSSCSSLKTIPLFNTLNVTNMQDMFNSCASFQSIPLFNTALVTNMANLFVGCNNLKEIPALSTVSITAALGTDFLSWQNCSSLGSCKISFARNIQLNNGQLSRTALVEIFTNLTNRTLTTAANINITGNWGASALTAADRLIATSKNWTITG